MSDFFNGGWSVYISLVAILGVVFCLWLLWTQRSWLSPNKADEESAHVWDGNITELNTTVPRWWTIMYIALCAFAVGYLILYPGLGSYKGVFGFTAAKQVQEQQQQINERLAPIYDRFREMPIEDIAADDEASSIGQRLFLNNCAQCHGSDAQGSPSFPNLTDTSWLWGGEPEQILHTITEGRRGIMPPHSAMMSPADASDIAQYVRSLNNLAHDPLRISAGKRGYDNACVACHGVDAKGNQLLGAPDLTDGHWLYGSSVAVIVEGIMNGRDNAMPAQKNRLTEEQIRLLAAWVWGLSNNSYD
ncbi:cytochrome-c oxidase, cbb3-type subunit III [Paenalcaligenes niemegkensis]|uniref:cytochrome-c oxidase, cbb3-type subunit III n=1 Tax=Paenalcaligenes niemegkensis TaxID=2895469 RepID=UPI001EE84EEF|nr:cytochrome-c oxidase, cbb3-type subunit III [Paenalcaligenes niemegkensis]MCQ9616761.1 cytochrome-c oxidase, cbb3-type subunit III [Paenalcaligenes niemegkensis]